MTVNDLRHQLGEKADEKRRNEVSLWPVSRRQQKSNQGEGTQGGGNARTPVSKKGNHCWTVRNHERSRVGGSRLGALAVPP